MSYYDSERINKAADAAQKRIDDSYNKIASKNANEEIVLLRKSVDHWKRVAFIFMVLNLVACVLLAAATQ